MPIDLQIASFLAPKDRPATSLDDLFRRKKIHTMAGDKRRYHDTMKSLRHSTWRTAESQNKQVQHFLNRAKFQQHQTWQAEYDRLQSSNHSMLNSHTYDPDINDRLERLRDLLLK